MALYVWLFILKKEKKDESIEFSSSDRRHQISLNNLPGIAITIEIF